MKVVDACDFWKSHVGQTVYTPDNFAWIVLSSDKDQVYMEGKDGGAQVSHHVHSHFLSMVHPADSQLDEIKRLNEVIAANRRRFEELQTAARTLKEERDKYREAIRKAEGTFFGKLVSKLS
jgi:hypothetical protein